MEEKRKIIEEWASLQADLRTQYEDFYRLTHACVESPLWAPVFRLWEAYTAEVSRRIGDQCEWLSWFELENEMGAKGHEVTVNGKGRNVRTLDDLLWVITSEA